MMKVMCSVFVLCFVFAACEKKEPGAALRSSALAAECGKEFFATSPVKVAETGIVLPVGTKLCITPDELTVKVELPKGHAFITGAPNKTLPVTTSTYTCICSKAGSPCQVFFAEGLGFGCLQSSCAGSCTGKFTYMGYSVDKVISTLDRELLFTDEEMQRKISETLRFAIVRPRKNASSADLVYVKQQIWGVNYYLLMDRQSVPDELKDATLLSARALCECEGTKACKLRTVSLRTMGTGREAIDIYFCDGLCNGCELTVD